ncbi:hypothetical protein SAMN02745824_1808 [Parasphingorhabdus marina DSM 22363]|uniref:Erythromycin esterase n=1 Tax=Parasphingorhabdus marina DSM 22363 TaxID=1123272 RepID=A0A1N6DC80_9SPHN|nr:hypothetical protein [Parasphingorhabdus marina]SIN68401.1 hypothetical protein SAMN02745824_1808 [Parasphingorhabdus marina DSM 22363]
MKPIANIVSATLLACLAPTVPVMAESAEDVPAYAKKLAEAGKLHRLALEYDGETFSGPAMDKLLEEGRKAQFFLIGEEHGIAENPELATALFKQLQPAGYAKLVIEVSPYVASHMDETLRKGGIDGLRNLFARPGGEPAFFGMREEAQFLADVRASSGSSEPLLWGVDYEVASERLLLSALEEMDKPEAAVVKLAALRNASDASWEKYEETRGPQYIFSFSGDPELVQAVKDAWPERSGQAEQLLNTLQQTLEINRLFVGRQILESNAQRSALIRSNFLKHWAAEKARGETPRVMVKLGASHLVRGRNFTEVFDLGPMLHEIATLEGGKAFSVLVLPGLNAQTAVFDPTQFSYRPAPAKDGYAKAARPLYDAAWPDKYTLIDLRPLRSILRSPRSGASASLMKTVHGFDMVLIMSGSTASAELTHP